MADTTNPFGGAAGSTGGMFGGGMWGGGGYGMQQPSPYGGYGGSYGGYGGSYGGFGGGMPYGGGYGAPSPYGAPGGYGGGYGGYSPYGMPQGYGGYGMQSPYGGYGGGYSPYGMPSQYGPQPSYGMPQQQTMAAPQTMASTVDGGTGDATASGNAVSPSAVGDAFNFSGSSSSSQTFAPWGPQGEQLRRLFSGLDANAEEISQKNMPTTGAQGELYKQQQLGPAGFDPQSEAALLRMQTMSTGANPMVDAATGAAQGVASGQYNIGTGGMFQGLYDRPGIQNLQQYQDMYSTPGIGGIDQYQGMANRNAIDNASQYSQLYNTPGIDQAGYKTLAAQNPYSTGLMSSIYSGPGVGTGNYQNILGGAGGQGSLAGGMFGQIAEGDRVNSNPYREKAISDAMAQTADDVKATMSSRGRYGSDAYGDAMGKALGQIATTARMQGYDTDTANMMAAAQVRSGEALSRQGIGLQAAQGIAGAEGTNVGNRLQAAQSIMNAGGANAAQQLAALQGLTGAQQAGGQMQLGAAQGLSGIQGTNYQSQLSALQNMNAAQQMANQQRMAAAQGLTGAQGQNWQNQLGAAQGLTGINSQDLQNRMTAAGMAPAMQGLRYDDIQRQLQAGATREAMLAQQRGFGWDQLARYQGLIGGVPGASGTTKTTDQKPWWQDALGAAAVGAGMWGQLNPLNV